MPPFSTKKKKEQLKNKRKQKRERDDDPNSFHRIIMEKTHFRGKPIGKQKEVNQRETNNGRERFADLQFFKDTDEELQQRKSLAMLPLSRVEEIDLEIEADCVAASLDMPKRPPWNRNFTKEQLERQEQVYFKEFVDKLLADATETDRKLSYFDLNLETWRQLWRVVEISDIVTIIVDIRHPLFHFPPALYRYIVEDMKKKVIIVLNKVDLVPAPLVIAWQQYLKSVYKEIGIIPFASYAGMKAKENGKRVGVLHMAADGARRFLDQVEDLVGKDRINFTSWRDKIQNEISSSTDEDIIEEGLENLKLADDNILTIGCAGHPNVGKSSFMNALIGKKLVSVSRTPGHTKHFQTIFLTPNVRLCDCPGLVFPSYYPKPLQVLMGCYPISQLREPYSSITYLAERIDLPSILKLRPVNDLGEFKKGASVNASNEWSAFSICESWAVYKGFLTARSGRPDVYRAANHLLRMALDGRTLCLSFYPPGYIASKGKDFKSEDIKEIERIQGKHNIIVEEGW